MSIRGLYTVAKGMIAAGIPIKCLEASVLALYLTNYISNMDRFRISRKHDLGGKPLRFESLLSLIREYERCYINNHHQLERVKIGSAEGSRVGSSKPGIEDGVVRWNEVGRAVDAYLRDIRNRT
ncbi:hypothetical protein BJ742DRAFT_742268 [Cladochytrium replicatum]|nr:hypothetical protein BJ742DRAFT_742268 [Cladochytrium replicatum]